MKKLKNVTKYELAKKYRSDEEKTTDQEMDQNSKNLPDSYGQEQEEEDDIPVGMIEDEKMRLMIKSRE